MARQGRHNEPLETLHGVVESYSEIEELLSNGDMSSSRAADSNRVKDCAARANVLTAAEQESAARRSTRGIPKYDSFAAGRMQLRFGTEAWARRSWSDSNTRKVEKTLGSVVLALEGELAGCRQQALEVEERRRRAAEKERQREEQRRREREREAPLKNREALAKDLRAKAGAWAEAQGVKAFVRAIADAVAPEARDATLSAWADEHARTLDPLPQPNSIAKPVSPARRDETAGDNGSS